MGAACQLFGEFLQTPQLRILTLQRVHLLLQLVQLPLECSSTRKVTFLLQLVNLLPQLPLLVCQFLASPQHFFDFFAELLQLIA